MDIEELTKSQLILLTILVNFVTAVATGILTVSFLDTAPSVVTQTVNHVIEHTIEKVAEAAPAAVIQAPQPSVEDLVTAAFAGNSARSITFYNPKVGTTTAIAGGTFLPKAKAAVMVNTTAPLSQVLVEFSDGSIVPASLAHANSDLVIYTFAADAKLPSVPSVSLIAAKDLKIGQTALVLTPKGGAATGIVSKVNSTGVYTSLPKAEAGASAVDLAGNLIGISGGDEVGYFISADVVRELLTATSTPAASVPST